MKTILLLGFVLMMEGGCNNMPNDAHYVKPKYDEGDIVYLKPDSIEAVIKQNNAYYMGDLYWVSNKKLWNHDRKVTESEIFGKKP